MRKIREAQSLINRGEFSTKVNLFFAVPSAGEDYDTYEQNYQYTNLNPITIKAYVHESSPSSLVFKQIGLHHTGAVEVITEEKYVNWFENAARIVIGDYDFQVYRSAVGNRSVIQRRPFKMARIFLTRKD